MSSVDPNGARPGADSIPDGTDDLRTRMKLRLAQNKAHAERDKASRPPPAGASVSATVSTSPGVSPGVSAGVSAGVRDRPASSGVSQMVWNSVLDSLSAPSAAPAQPAEPAPAVAAQPVVVAEPVVVPGPVVVAEPVVVAQPVVVAEPVVVADPVVDAETVLVTPAVPAPVESTTSSAETGEQQAIADLFKEPAPASDFGPIVPAMPVLAPPSRAVTPPRTNPAAHVDETVIAGTAAVMTKKQAKQAAKAAKGGKGATNTLGPRPGPATMMAMQQRKKRHPIRAFLTFVLVVALLGGAAFAGWYKFLRHHAAWSNELRPAAAFVEQTVHRSFDKTVPVKVLSVPEYEVKLGLAVLDRLAGTASASGTTAASGTAGASGTAADGSAAGTTSGPDMSLLAVRAIGLIGADLQPTAVGHLVAASSPSFYSTTDHTIYRLAGDSSVFQVSLIRSMTAALLDQDLDIGTVVRGLTDAQRTGFQAMLDGVVARVVDAKFRADPATADSYTFELQTRRTEAGIVDGALPVYLAGSVTSADNGVSGYMDAPAEDPLRGLNPPLSDAPVFDPTRDPTAEPATIAGVDGGEPRVLGVAFWFEALVPVLGAGDARHAALLWNGDRSVTSLRGTQACLSSTVATATADDAAALLGLIGRWVQSRPASAGATVTAGTNIDQATVDVVVCEPTEGVVPPTASVDDLASFFVQPDTERALLQRVGELGAPLTPNTTACVIAAYRNGSIPGFTTGAADPAIVTALTNVVTFCRAGE